MITTLVLMMLLGNGDLKVVKTMTASSVEQCVNQALLINQDMALPVSAFCFHEVKK